MTWLTVERILRWACGVITIGSMSAAVIRLVLILNRANKQIGNKPIPRLRRPWYYLVGSFLFAILLILLWIPLPIKFGMGWSIGLDAAGSMLLLFGLAGYQWGHITLGSMFTGSSSREAPLFQDHSLVTSGPYRISRHPMYLALQIAAFGSLLLYRNWAVVFCFLSFIFLFLRARREEDALLQRFGAAWEKYRNATPFWFPRIHTYRK